MLRIMNEKLFKRIKDLTELQGISGNEKEVRDYMVKEMTPLVDEIEVTGLGNVFGVKKTSVKDAPRIMIAAHMDEVGFMVSQINENGTFNVVPIGGWNVYAVSAQRFTLQTHKGNYPCISSAVSPHLLREGKAQELKASDILFEAGFESKEEAEEYGVRPGDSVVPQSETIMTANKKSIIAKAWDNRYGCTLVLDLLESTQGKELPSELVTGASVQEEVGLRGIKGAVNRYRPDLFIAVDCSPAGDSEGKEGVQGRLGEGFLLRVQDPGMITHKGLRDYLLDTAESNQIPYQHFFSKGGTDAGAAHTMNDGIISGVIGVPARYIHGHQSLFRISDYEAAKAMAEAVATSFDRTTYETLVENS